ncbi:MAG TPA: hypothetical protein QGG47_16920 [Acidobacteriota bacterium]|nr:hypothetical protein [Acidobacteriota bacterium]
MTEIPERIGGYKVEARLDEGGQSEVYKAAGDGGGAVAILL